MMGTLCKETAFATNRRSQRIFHRMKLRPWAETMRGKKFREVCETLVVNAHGGLLILRHEVDNDEMLVLVNPVNARGNRSAGLCSPVRADGRESCRCGISDASATLLGHRALMRPDRMPTAKPRALKLSKLPPCTV